MWVLECRYVGDIMFSIPISFYNYLHQNNIQKHFIVPKPFSDFIWSETIIMATLTNLK